MILPAVSHPRQFHAESLRIAQTPGGRQLQTSVEAGWRSLLLARREMPEVAENVETLPTGDYHIGLSVRGASEFLIVSNGRTHRSTKRPGFVTFTPPRHTHRMTWRALGPQRSEVLSIFVPPAYFEEAAEEYRRAGTRLASADLCAMHTGDGTIAQVLQSLSTAAAQGMPDSYADSAARFLAAHLLSATGGWSSLRRSPGELTDRRLARVLEYLDHHHREDVSNEALAAVAGISPFHFTRVFKRKVGCTPHRYVQGLRMRSARAMLRATDLSVLEVASACGYANASHFAAAFFRAFGQNPAEFRGGLR